MGRKRNPFKIRRRRKMTLKRAMRRGWSAGKRPSVFDGGWGDGGALVTSDPELDHEVRLLRSHGDLDSLGYFATRRAGSYAPLYARLAAAIAEDSRLAPLGR